MKPSNNFFRLPKFSGCLCRSPFIFNLHFLSIQYFIYIYFFIFCCYSEFFTQVILYLINEIIYYLRKYDTSKNGKIKRTFKRTEIKLKGNPSGCTISLHFHWFFSNPINFSYFMRHLIISCNKISCSSTHLPSKIYSARKCSIK